MSQYISLGAATGPSVSVRPYIDRSDVQYLSALIRGLNADLDALVSQGKTAYTEGRAKLLVDKTGIWNEAWDKFATLKTADAKAANELLASLPSEKATIEDAVGKVPGKLSVVGAWTPIPDPSPFVAPPYKKDVPFCSAPVAMPTSPIQPSKELLAKLLTPLSTHLQDYELSMKMARGFRPAPVASGATGTGGLLALAGAAIAAYFLMK